MKKKNNKSLVLIICSIVIVLIITVVIVLNTGDRKKIAVAAQDIKSGTIINKDNAESYISIKKVSEEKYMEGDYFDIESLDGMSDGVIMMSDIAKSDPINSDDVMPYTDPAKLMSDPVVIGLKANESSEFVSGIIRKGDHVNISVVNRTTGECEPVMDNVYVCGAYNSDGSETSDDGCAMLINILVEKSMEKEINEKIQLGTVRISKIGSDGFE